MNVPLVPCAACHRHIRVREPSCPFCGASVEAHRAQIVPIPSKRLGSLAVMTFRGTALGAALVACGGTDDAGNAAHDGGAEVGAGGASTGIGGSPNDNLGGSPGTGGTGNATGGQAGTLPPDDGGQVPIYRATPRGP